MKVNFNVAFKNFDGKDVTETYQEVVHEEAVSYTHLTLPTNSRV